MTPAAGWHPNDYYRASRAARRACEARSEQLQIGGVLEEPGEGRVPERADVASAATPGSSSTPDMRVGAGFPSSDARHNGVLDPTNRKDMS